MTGIDTAIVQTLAFFDIFDRPLTETELYELLWNDTAIDRNDFVSFLTDAVKWGTAAYRTGLYMLPGREGIVDIHQSRIRLVEEKSAVARRAARLLRFIPFLRAVFVCNTVALGAPKPESDVDVFIVVKQSRLWLVRLLATGLLELFGLRRHGEHVANKVCLSFYATDNALDFSSLRLWPDDVYLAYWLTQLVPVYDPEQLFGVIMKKNTWLRAHLPHVPRERVWLESRGVRDRWYTLAIKYFFTFFLSGFVGTFFEQQAKRVQQWKMKKNTKSVQNEPDTRVVISDTMLKFHENDRRGLYRELWMEKRRKFGIN